MIFGEVAVKNDFGTSASLPLTFWPFNLQNAAVQQRDSVWEKKYAMCDSATSATSNNMKLVHGCMGLLHLVQRGEDRTGSQPTQALLAVPNVTAHPSTASVPITVLLLCGFNAPITGLILRTLAVVNTKTENPPKLFPGDRGEDIAT